MELRGIEFGKVFCAPGARNFDGNGYPFHRIAKLLGLTWENTTFVAKTTTMEPRKGNLPLKTDGVTPKQARPKCIVVKFRNGHVLNAVGLSGPGAPWLFARAGWNTWSEPFMISFMAVGDKPEDRWQEANRFHRLLNYYLREMKDFKAPLALQLNFGCPNTEHDQQELLKELDELVSLFANVGIPLVINLSVATPSIVVGAISDNPQVDALWLANTVPWGHSAIDWEAIFGTDESPLILRGYKQAGGLSGPECLTITETLVREVRKLGVKKPIVAGNGIQKPSDVIRMKVAGADAIALGVIGIVRPWRMQNVIKTGLRVF